MVQFEEPSLGWPWLSSALPVSVRIDDLQGIPPAIVIVKDKTCETVANSTFYRVERPPIHEINGVRLDEAIPEG
jgi:hypothetical protein